MEQKIIDRYKSHYGAEHYNTLYEKELHKRLSHKREVKVIRKAFAHLDGVQDRMLDLPSGTGRLFPTIQPFAKRYVETDVSLEMLKFARQNLAAWQPHLVEASGLAIPYKDGTFDCVFSARLMHHIRDDGERRRFVRELGRVSRRWVIVTYFHKWSLKNLLRVIRHPFNSKKPKVVWSTGEMRSAADAAGLELIASIPLARLFSGHHYAVLRKRS